MSIKAESSPGSLVQNVKHSHKYVCHFIASKKLEAVAADCFTQTLETEMGKFFTTAAAFGVRGCCHLKAL